MKQGTIVDAHRAAVAEFEALNGNAEQALERLLTVLRGQADMVALADLVVTLDQYDLSFTIDHMRRAENYGACYHMDVHRPDDTLMFQGQFYDTIAEMRAAVAPVLAAYIAELPEALRTGGDR